MAGSSARFRGMGRPGNVGKDVANRPNGTGVGGGAAAIRDVAASIEGCE
jgi:hypothetical protein